jgi:hypothetical protein
MSEPKKAKKRAAPEAAPAAPVVQHAATDAPEVEASASPLDAWTGYWLSPIAAARIFLLRKIILLVLAFDVLATHLSPAWRYGAAGFNVPHFAWMRALPIPTTSFYVGMLFVVALGSFIAAIVPKPPRILLAVIAVLYLWGWSCSMLDSYQHHYLLSLVLLVLAAMPVHDATELYGQATSIASTPHGVVPRVHAFGYTLLTSLAGSVYLFTAVSKTAEDWLSGDALRLITREGSTIEGFFSFTSQLGMDRDETFWFLGHSMVPLQLIIAAGYFLAPLLDGPNSQKERTQQAELAKDWMAGNRGNAILASGILGVLIGVVAGFGLSLDALGIACLSVVLAGALALMPFNAAAWTYFFSPKGRAGWVRIVCSIALVAALSFHVGAEYLGLEIGWFSYYMLAVALLVLLPGTWLSTLLFGITALVRGPSKAPSIAVLLVWILLAGAGLFALGRESDLPGALAATGLVGVLLAMFVLPGLKAPHAEHARYALATAFAAALLFGWLHATEARFDFHRFAAGDFRRRLDYQSALTEYESANRVAPEGQSRETRVEEMREALRERRGEPDPNQDRR